MPGRWRAAGAVLSQRIGGVVTVAMGLVFLDMAPALQRDVRLHKVLCEPVDGYEKSI
ncbi:hypothetical protein SAMN05216215_101073 [Saccharopolyspora shandongensis]|uniref:Uncharacterized protein n=1 Tax=Saccharopolyspora shandongensis TaxID=418495 RepID=A0A1H3B674_9PSEU|nr:hypothetical protein SAMN05216215_101073 [Saccharopolyspora shandongensis]